MWVSIIKEDRLHTVQLPAANDFMKYVTTQTKKLKFLIVVMKTYIVLNR